MPLPIPDQLASAIDSALQAKADVDASMLAKQNTANQLSAATDADNQAAADLANKTTILTARREALEALEDQYLTPGGSLPASGTAKA